MSASYKQRQACLYKERFHQRRHAEKTRRRASWLAVYRCPVCFGYHLTGRT